MPQMPRTGWQASVAGSRSSMVFGAPPHSREVYLFRVKSVHDDESSGRWMQPSHREATYCSFVGAANSGLNGGKSGYPISLMNHGSARMRKNTVLNGSLGTSSLSAERPRVSVSSLALQA